jgi:hypothetical protein
LAFLNRYPKAITLTFKVVLINYISVLRKE